MKKIRFVLCIVVLAVLSCGTLMAQKTYEYKTYPNDPLGVREYTLDNGLKVFMSVYKDAPKIQTYIAVRAGSRNDPPRDHRSGPLSGTHDVQGHPEAWHHQLGEGESAHPED